MIQKIEMPQKIDKKNKAQADTIATANGRLHIIGSTLRRGRFNPLPIDHELVIQSDDGSESVIALKLLAAPKEEKVKIGGRFITHTKVRFRTIEGTGVVLSSVSGKVFVRILYENGPSDAPLTPSSSCVYKGSANSQKFPADAPIIISK